MKEKIKEYIQQYEKGGFTYKELEWELLNLFSVTQRSELLLKQQSDWLMKNTTLSVEAIVEFQEKFKQ